jgi:hypothetical protein
MYETVTRPETPDAVGEIMDRMHKMTSKIAQQRRARMLALLSPASEASGSEGSSTKGNVVEPDDSLGKDNVIRELRGQLNALRMENDGIKRELDDAKERADANQRAQEQAKLLREEVEEKLIKEQAKVLSMYKMMSLPTLTMTNK